MEELGVWGLRAPALPIHSPLLLTVAIVRAALMVGTAPHNLRHVL